jgi:hypothetical protein
MPATHPTYDPHLIRHHDSRGSNSTLDEPECHSSDSAGKLAQFGHPLERMVHVEMDDDFPFEYMPSSTTASSACSTASAFSDDESTSSCPPEMYAPAFALVVCWAEHFDTETLKRSSMNSSQNPFTRMPRPPTLQVVPIIQRDR